MNRSVLHSLVLAALLLNGSWLAAAPPRVLYSNDATNLLNSPHPALRSASIPQRLHASIDEAADADAHLLQPGNGWVPWWTSASYPADEHYRWFQEISGRNPDPIGRYMMAGGDLVQEFVEHCRSRAIRPFVSLRLNDYHGAEGWDILRALMRGEGRGETFPVSLGALASQSRALLERSDLQLHPDPENYLAASPEERQRFLAEPSQRIRLRTARIWNWAHPEVPASRLTFIRELAEGYDLDGLELDFMRWSSFFRLNETSSAQRSAIMLEFVQQVRAILDSTAGSGARRLLGVRVPSRISGHDPLGIDLPSWVAAGVDFVTLSCHYVTEQQTDLVAIRKLIPDTPVYLELTFASSRQQAGAGYRPTSPEQLQTAAHLAYTRGAAGVSLFNFAYYRTLATVREEPPFEVIRRLKNPEWLAAQPQHYFLSESGNPPSDPSQFTRHRRLRSGQSRVFDLDLAPPRNGWTGDAELVIEATAPLSGNRLEVAANGVPLAASTDAAPESHTWRIPVGVLRAGANQLQIRNAHGPALELFYISLTP